MSSVYAAFEHAPGIIIRYLIHLASPSVWASTISLRSDLRMMIIKLSEVPIVSVSLCNAEQDDSTGCG